MNQFHHEIHNFPSKPSQEFLEKIFILNQENTPEVGSLSSIEYLRQLIQLSSYQFYVVKDDEIKKIFSILGITLRKPKKFELIFWVITGLIVLTGFGSFFSILYKPFYSLLPFFSKFRIPSMIYLLLAITIPILGARGLDIFLEVYEQKKEMRSPIETDFRKGLPQKYRD